MNDLEKLLIIQQEYEYFTKHSKTEEDFIQLDKNPVFQSAYIKNILATCNKQLAVNKLREKKRKCSKMIFIAILVFYSILTVFAVTQF